MATPKVLIGYSRADQAWKEELFSHLRGLELAGFAEFWDTSDLRASADWEKEIEKAVRQSDIAVLLISLSFLASEFIVLKELPEVLARRRKEGIAVVPILVRPARWSLNFRNGCCSFSPSVSYVTHLARSPELFCLVGDSTYRDRNLSRQS